MDRQYAQLELKAVDSSKRTIQGYAAIFGNVDRTGDLIEKGAFDRTLKESGGDVLVLLGHDASRLPVGEPIELRADSTGLFANVRVYDTADGNDLLEVARQRMAAGKSLGLSIGYRTTKEKRVGGVRHLLDLDLMEFSFLASPALAANPLAVSVGMKARKETRSMEINDLPDSAFAFIAEDGVLDAERKTVPRESRHFAHHAADGSLDTDLLTVALEEATSSEHGEKASAHLHRHALKAGLTQSDHDDTHSAEWSQGAAPALLAAGWKLIDLAEDVAKAHDAMKRLGLDTKNGDRLNAGALARLNEALGAMGHIKEWAESIERGEDGILRVEMFKHRLAMLQLEEVS